MSDSGTSGYESCSSDDLSERERRLAYLRRLARDLESSLVPGSKAWNEISLVKKTDLFTLLENGRIVMPMALQWQCRLLSPLFIYLSIYLDHIPKGGVGVHQRLGSKEPISKGLPGT